MNICTSLAINNAIVAASCANAAAAMADSSNDCYHDIDIECDEHNSFWLGLLAIAIVFVIIPAIVVGLLMLLV